MNQTEMHIEISGLGEEWITLQNNYEQYERNGLFIKLTCIVLFAVGFAMGFNGFWMSALVLLLWVQEAIFRTYQSRLGSRLLRLESLLKQGAASDGGAFQLHTQWLAGRPGFTGLLMEYGASACRPTVAFPYLVLVVFAWLT